MVSRYSSHFFSSQPTFFYRSPNSLATILIKVVSFHFCCFVAVHRFRATITISRRIRCQRSYSTEYWASFSIFYARGTIHHGVCGVKKDHRTIIKPYRKLRSHKKANTKEAHFFAAAAGAGDATTSFVHPIGMNITNESKHQKNVLTKEIFQKSCKLEWFTF